MKTEVKDDEGNVVALLDGVVTIDALPVPAEPGWTVTSYATADDVRAEASRRMQIAFGARDTDHLEIVIANANREAIRLLRKGSDNWTTDEATRAAQLEGADQLLEAIRAASNALEPLDPVPLDYADDKHWP